VGQITAPCFPSSLRAGRISLRTAMR
jgi:hypothetical protein